MLPFDVEEFTLQPTEEQFVNPYNICTLRQLPFDVAETTLQSTTYGTVC